MALAGVHFRTGSLISKGKRVLSDIVHRFGTLNVVDDNAGCFGSRPAWQGPCLIMFGSFVVYVATEIECNYPELVVTAEDPPSVCAIRGQPIDGTAGCVEVLATVGPSQVFEDPEDPESPPRARSARHPLEREENMTDLAGASGVVLQEAIERLGMPISASADQIGRASCRERV